MAIILTCDLYSARLDKTPEACDDDMYALVEFKHPIELTPHEGSKRVPDKPGEFIHGIESLFAQTAVPVGFALRSPAPRLIRTAQMTHHEITGARSAPPAPREEVD